MKQLLLLLTPAVLLSGCLGDFLESTCSFSPDEDHCYQAAAVQGSEPDTCEKVKGEGFKGTNPPKDKCFLQIAENTGDPSVCDSIEGGMMSYTQEECLDAVFRSHTVDACKDAEDQIKCRTGYAKRFGECGDGYTFNKVASACEVRKPEIKGTDDDIESKVEGELTSLGDAAKGKYMDLLEKSIENEDDPAKKLGLEKYKEFLEKSGETLEDVQGKVETLKELKRIFLDAYDPSMDIERMPVDKILAKGLVDRIKDHLFGEGTPTPAEKENSSAEDAISVYEAMLKRQEEIDFLKKGKLERLGDVVVSNAKDKGTEKLKETVTGIAEGVAGTAFATVGIVGDALESFKDEAQKQMFVGLARAYNRRREAIEQSNPNLGPDEIHKRTVAQVQDDPYQDNTNTGFVKHGNLLANKDCKDESNPLCIDNAVWWTAMDKTYQYGKK
jgi:hypothetical protein